MNLGNSFEAIVHYLLVEGMTNLDHEDEVSMVTILIYMVTFWTEPLMSREIGYRIVIISSGCYST